jgi:hypothetical protein
MTPRPLWTPLALGACMIMTASCAASRPPSAVAPPRLILPEAATRPCDLAVLPEGATAADLEAVYVRRGGQVLACDAARRLAVETLAAERKLIDAWAAGRSSPVG